MHVVSCEILQSQFALTLALSAAGAVVIEQTKSGLGMSSSEGRMSRPHDAKCSSDIWS